MATKDLKGLEEKILNHVHVGKRDECWKWEGAFVQGCATVYHEGKSHYVSRYIYMFANKNFRVKERAVRHSCRNKGCCNPRHLVLGRDLVKATFDPEKLRKKYLAYVDIGSADDCWLWKKGGLNNGYGFIMHNRTSYMAHRLAYYFSHEGFDISSDKLVFHRCKERSCCNPNHLYLKDNIRGENNMQAKLTWKSVQEIRQMYFDEKISKTKIAKKFGVSPAEILYIVRRRLWDWLK